MSDIRPAIVLTLLFTALLGLAYPLAITGVGQAVMPAQANGSLVMRGGAVVGSSLIGQSFASERYFHGRPSATSAADPADASRTIDAPYNAANSTGSNLGPSSKSLFEAVQARAAALGTGPHPADLVTASASGSIRTSPRPGRWRRSGGWRAGATCRRRKCASWSSAASRAAS